MCDRTITLELNDLLFRYLAYWLILRLSRSGSRVKVTCCRKMNVAKVDGATSSDGVLVKFLRRYAYVLCNVSLNTPIACSFVCFPGMTSSLAKVNKSSGVHFRALFLKFPNF